jgi:hypothetical protein
MRRKAGAAKYGVSGSLQMPERRYVSATYLVGSIEYLSRRLTKRTGSEMSPATAICAPSPCRSTHCTTAHLIGKTGSRRCYG